MLRLPFPKHPSPPAALLTNNPYIFENAIYREGTYTKKYLAQVPKMSNFVGIGRRNGVPGVYTEKIYLRKPKIVQNGF